MPRFSKGQRRNSNGRAAMRDPAVVSTGPDRTRRSRIARQNLCWQLCESLLRFQPTAVNGHRTWSVGCRWLAAAWLGWSCSPLGAQEYRAFWADAFHAGFRSASEVTRLIDDVRSANANAVVVEVRKRGDAYYDSQFEPWATDISPAGFDPLQDLLNKAHDTNAGARIEVHAWMVTFPIWGNETTPPSQTNHPYNLHPDWLSQDKNSNTFATSYYVFDPGHPGVQEHTFNVAMDIIQHYDVDGLNFDYIRYPNYNWGYNPVAVARFNRRFGRTGQPAAQDADWLQWRRDQVTALLRKIYVCAQAVKPQVKISADTITWHPSVTSDAAWVSSARAYNEVLQDWRSWMEEGILDLNMPMAYFRQTNTTYATDYVNWRDFAADRRFNRHVIIGPGIYLNSISNGVVQMRRTREPSPGGNYVQGVCGYSYAVPATDAIPNLQSNFFAALTQPSAYDPVTPPIFAAPDMTPTMPWKTAPTAGHLKGFVREPVGHAGIDGAVLDLVGPSTRVLRTDATGFFGAVDLAPGTYTLSAWVNGYPQYLTNVTVVAGSVSSCDVLLDPPLEFLNLSVIAGERGARVSWTTLVPATSQVEFGTDTNCSRQSEMNAEAVLEHSVLLTGLDANTLYCARALSSVGASRSRSTNLWFRTSPEIVIDNPDALLTGSWSTGNGAGRYLEDYYFGSTVSGAATRTARYVPAMVHPGYYDVFAWYPEGDNRSTNVPYRIEFDGGSTTIRVNQQTGGGQWRLLTGHLPFAAGTSGFVEISNSTGEPGGRMVMADAVRFAYSPGQDTPGEGTVPAWWAYHYYGGMIDPALDSDGDGYAAWQEYRLGTIPTSAASRLQFRLELQGDLNVAFGPHFADRVYGLERAVDLAAGAWEPLSLPDPLAFPNGMAGWVLPYPTEGSVFFRLTVDWGP